MKIAKFWAKEIGHSDNGYGDTYRLISWAGSNSSIEDAKKNALEKIERWRERLASDDTLQDHYPYDLDGEIREELVEEIVDRSGTLIGAITRNRYGALVLNAPDVMFIDVDLPPISRKRKSLLSSLLGLFRPRNTKSPTPDPDTDPRTHYISKFTEYQQAHPHLSLRIYETRAGFRLVVLNQLFDPLSDATHAIFEDLGSDQLYRHLCKAQRCFRARLTAKPWRAGLKQPSYPFPREEPGQAQSFKQWLDTYDKKTGKLAVCRHLEDLGNAETHQTVTEILNLHDKYVLGSGTDPLY